METQSQPKEERVVMYARVSSPEHKENLERQVERLLQYCTVRGYQVTQVVKEIASGVNDSRPKLLALLKDRQATRIVVEHKDRLTRFGFRYLETLLELQCRTIEVVNVAEHDREDLIADLLVEEGIGTLVIGLNKGWKQGVEMGRRNNQTFVQIPHSRLTQMLEYKAQLVGIAVIVREESYTSKASFLDLDETPTYDAKREAQPVFSGKRETRGLYRAKNGRRVQADINGSYNCLRKEFPNAFPNSLLREGQGIVGAAVHPRRMSEKRRKDMGPSSQSAD